MRFKFEAIQTFLLVLTAALLVHIHFTFAGDFNVVLYKISITTTGAIIGFFIDLSLFRAGGELQDQESEICKAAVLLRRGFIVGVLSLAMSGAM